MEAGIHRVLRTIKFKYPQMHTSPYKVIRPKELCEILSVSRTTLWRMEEEGKLPKRRKITTGTVGWLGKDIEDWLEERPFVNDGKTQKNPK